MIDIGEVHDIHEEYLKFHFFDSKIPNLLEQFEARPDHDHFTAFAIEIDENSDLSYEIVKFIVNWNGSTILPKHLQEFKDKN
jgi:hypothetical protein